MARYLDPKADLTFKRIFGEHPDLLISFLNALMPFEAGRVIETIEYLPSEQPPDTTRGKNSIVDVRCKDNFGRQFIVEMQMLWDEDFKNRIVFNAGKAYVRQLKRKGKYNSLQTVYTLAILNENFDNSTEEFIHHFKIVNCNNINEIIPGLEFVLVELTEKFRPETISDRKLTVLWLRFLNEVGENMTKLPPEMQENELISHAAELCEAGAFTPEELAVYDGYWDSIRVEAALIDGALRKGRAEGETIGLEKVAINAHKAGHSIEVIATFTGLTPQQISEILKQNNLV